MSQLALPDCISTIDGQGIRMLGIILLAMALLSSSASAECSICTSFGSLINEKISSFLPFGIQSDTPEGSTKEDMLISAEGIAPTDVILDVSDGQKTHIPGAIHVSYKEFMDNNNSSTLQSVPEMADVLGKAGISSGDSVVVYGECQPCGGGPTSMTFGYWVLRYLGHEKVKILDGGISAWKAAGKPVANTTSTLPSTTYEPHPRPELLATNDYVKSGAAQIIDARSEREFNSSTIPGAMNIPYDEVLSGKKIRNETELEDIFRNLTKDQPVVVFTQTGVKGSVVWFALKELGYDAKLYTYKQWILRNREKYKPIQNESTEK